MRHGAKKMNRGLEQAGCEMELFSLEKKRLQGDLIAAIQYLKGAGVKRGRAYFTQAGSDKRLGAMVLD